MWRVPTGTNKCMAAKRPACSANEASAPTPLQTTIFPVYFRQRPCLEYRRECVQNEDGGHFTLDWLHSCQAGVLYPCPRLNYRWISAHAYRDTADGGHMAWQQGVKVEYAPGTPTVLLLSGIAGGSGDACGPYAPLIFSACSQFLSRLPCSRGEK